MKRHILIFILAMTVDVRVRARPLEVPKTCTQSNQECALLAKNAIDELKTESAVLFFAKDTSLIQRANQSITLVRGLARVEASSTTHINNLYGDLMISDGSVLIEATDSIFKFTNLSAALLYRPRGEKQFHKLPIGYSTYFSFITKSGVADAGFPHPAEIEILIKKWGQVVYKADQKKFSDELRNFLISWSDATQAVDDWYVNTVQREIASLRAEEDRQARRKAAQEAENAKYKQMFRSRIFNQW